MAKRAADWITERLEGLGEGQAQLLAEKSGISAAQISRWRNWRKNGERPPNLQLETVEKLASALRLEVAELFGGSEPESPAEWKGFKRIGLAGVVDAGPGHDLQAEPGEDYVFREGWFKRVGVSKEAAAIVKIHASSRFGSSMVPTLLPGALLAIDTAPRALRSGEIYLVWRKDEGLLVKRVFVAGHDVVLFSDNEQYSPRVVTVPKDELGEGDDAGRLIRGRVVWSGKEL